MRWILFAGFTAVAACVGLFWLNHPRALPAASQAGSGQPVTLVLFSDQGQRLQTVNIGKVVKTDAEWRRELNADQFSVTRKKATEFAYQNLYWNQHAHGIYRCICCGNALFRSEEKYDSDTGWPSFWAPIAPENVFTAEDHSLTVARTEVLCRKCNAHLGHMFDDGPPPTGQRYCLNSAALRFIQSR